MAEKAVLYQISLEKEFLSKEGWVCYAKPSGIAGPYYDDLPRQGEITGYQLCAEVSRYQATRSPDAVYNIHRILQGIEWYFRITAVVGLPARAMAPSISVDPSWKWSSASHLLQESDPMVKYHYRSDTPKEQIAVFLVGLSQVCRHLKEYPALTRRSAVLLGAMADHLYRHYQSLVGRYGQKTEGGDFPMWVIMLPGYGELPLAHNALACLSAQILAHDATGESRYKLRALELLSNDLMERLKPMRWSTGNHDNDALCFLSAYSLLQSPNFSERELLRQAMRRLYRAVEGERNVLWALMTYEHLPSTDISWVRDALKRFPPSKHGRSVWPTDQIPRRWFTCHGAASAEDPLELDQRIMRDFVWTSCPLELADDNSEIKDQDIAGTDYLYAYWLALRLGVITSED
ncbi:MAG: hypothetical protein AB7F75_03955 [Planctomycetota bacterium]